jgi:hypothetical protein
MGDRATRMLAAIALAVALLALVIAGYAVWLGQEYREDVRLLGESLSGATHDPPLHAPPPSLDPDDR